MLPTFSHKEGAMLYKLVAFARKLGPPLALAVAATLLVTGLGVALNRPISPSALAGASTGASTSDPPQCYAWDVANNTGFDADGLSAQFDGVIAVTEVYTGAANPLGEPRAASGYDAVNDRYTLLLGANAATIGAGDSVRAGFCTPTPVTLANLTWLSGTVALLPNTVPPVLAWHWLSAGLLEAEVHNTTGVAATVLSLEVLAPAAPVTLDDLDPAVVASFNLAAAGLDEPVALGPTAVLPRTLTLTGLNAGDPIVLVMQWSTDEDLANINTAYVATSVPGRLYLPNVRRQ
jgi:hypothetical protein